MKGTEYFVSLQTSVVITEEYNVLVDSEELTLISGFRRDVDVICGLFGDYTASWGK
jgi:hypothetical protein